MSATDRLPAGLALVPIGLIERCPIQPRVNVSMDLVTKLTLSMKNGRHEPLLDVEVAPGHTDRYRIVCGEQRWRAAREAGMEQVLVRVHPHLGYLERLQKQYEENRLRSPLDPVEDGRCLQLAKTIRDIEFAEQLLRDSLVPFQPLDDRPIERREEFREHLNALKRLLVKHKVHVVKTEAGPAVGPLSVWSDTERALGVSESQRKAKVGILRLDSEDQERVRGLPAEHAIQISRLPDKERRSDLIDRAPELTHREVRRAVDRLLAEPHLDVDGALSDDQPHQLPGPITFEARLDVIADLCRQLVRALRNLALDADEDERSVVMTVLGGLEADLAPFRASREIDNK